MSEKNMEPNQSHWVEEYSGSEDEYLNQICYAQLWSGRSGMTGLRLLFPPKGREIYKLKEYVNYILNSDLFGDAFLTKSYDEGMKKGFVVDIHQPTNLLFMSFAALRWPWEQTFSEWCSYHFSWGLFKNMGFDNNEALFLTNHFSVEERVLVWNDYNDNHKPVPQIVPFSEMVPGNFRRQLGTMAEGCSSAGVMGNWEITRRIDPYLSDSYEGKAPSYGLLKKVLEA